MNGKAVDREVKEMAIELISILLDTYQDGYELSKAVMLSTVQHPAYARFLDKILKLVEERRPKMIEVKF